MLDHILGPSHWSFLLILIGGLLGGTLQGADPLSQNVERTGPVSDAGARSSEAESDAPRVAAATPDALEHPLAPAIRLAQGSLMHVQSVQDYEATLIKRERLDGSLVQQIIHMKVREQPLSLYLKYGEPVAGREVLFVQGQNNNQLWTHEGAGATSFVGTQAVDPIEIRESRYPVTKLGMRQMLEAVLAQWKQESLYAESDVQYFPDAQLRGRPCEIIEATHPRPRRQFKFQKTHLYIDAETRLPIRVDRFSFPAMADQESPLEESYEYSHLQTNLNLTDLDFDRQNPNYAF